MRTFYYSTAIITTLAFLIAVYFLVAVKEPTSTIPLLILIFVNCLAVIVWAIDKTSQGSSPRTEKIIPLTNEAISNCPDPKIQTAPESIIANDWSNKMYDYYVEKWNQLFDKVTYPLDKSTKGEIIALCWEISSITIDYLMVANDDPNLLQRNKTSVQMLLDGKKPNDLELKDFYDDPSTVPAKVLAIYNILKSNSSTKQKLAIPAFGYLVEIGKTIE